MALAFIPDKQDTGHSQGFCALPDIYSLKVTSKGFPFLLNIPSIPILLSASVFFLSPQNDLNFEHIFLVLL